MPFDQNRNTFICIMNVLLPSALGAGGFVYCSPACIKLDQKGLCLDHGALRGATLRCLSDFGGSALYRLA